MRLSLLIALLMVSLALPLSALAVCTTEVGGVNTAILTWTNPDVTDPVVILRATVSGGPYTQIASVPAGTLSYTDMAVAASNVTLFYVVKNNSAAAGLSLPSNEACKTFFAIPPSPGTLTVN